MHNFIYYAKIEKGDKSGFTNRIISFVQAIIEGIRNKCKIVICDNYINDPENNVFVPISDIIDLVDLNGYLISKYNILVIDKNFIQLNILNAIYGTDEKMLDITEEIQQCILSSFPNSFFINKYMDFNRIKGDPDVGKPKKIYITYGFALNLKTSNNYIYKIKETYDEILSDHIAIDVVNAKYTFVFNSLQDSVSQPVYFQVFNEVFTKIKYTQEFHIHAAKTMLQINMNRTISVIHLRIEQDAIDHWFANSGMNAAEFKETIETKYIQLIQKYISKDGYIVVLSDAQNNAVMRFLQNDGYNVVIPEKYYGSRHLNAIVDMLISKYCNGVFIGCINLNRMNGSTFSYYCQKMMDASVKRVMFDIDSIRDPEMIY